MPFDPSTIHQFTIPGDNTNIYLMLDERIVEEALAGLTPAQQAAINAYRWTPSAQQLADGLVSTWGGDPVAVYFRTTLAKAKAALAKRWREVT